MKRRASFLIGLVAAAALLVVNVAYVKRDHALPFLRQPFPMVELRSAADDSQFHVFRPASVVRKTILGHPHTAINSLGSEEVWKLSDGRIISLQYASESMGDCYIVLWPDKRAWYTKALARIKQHVWPNH